jgi:hypothetical protein
VQSGNRHYLIKLDDLVTFIAGCIGAPESWVARRGLLGQWLAPRLRLALGRLHRLAVTIRTQIAAIVHSV